MPQEDLNKLKEWEGLWSTAVLQIPVTGRVITGYFVVFHYFYRPFFLAHFVQLKLKGYYTLSQFAK